MPLAFDRAALDRGLHDRLAWVRAQYRRPAVVAGTGVVIAAFAGMALAAALRPTYPGPRLQPAARMAVQSEADPGPEQLSVIVSPPPQPAAAELAPPQAALQPAADVSPRRFAFARMPAPPRDDQPDTPPFVADARGYDGPLPAPADRRRHPGNPDNWAPNSPDSQIAAAEGDDPQSPPDDRRPPHAPARDGGPDSGPNGGSDGGW